MSVLVADRGPRQESSIVQLAGDLRRRAEGVEGLERLPGAMGRVAELEQDLRALGRVLLPSSRAVPSRRAASSNASASVAAPAARRLYSIARSAPPRGAASVKW